MIPDDVGIGEAIRYDEENDRAENATNQGGRVLVILEQKTASRLGKD